ncbi:protein stum homolog [Sinocyclocheilus rhinocerous]|uniref:protein stum homolog n=1 Tax=Sinocyclocheilus rhinocerous TaxID=307959 RepID=UPI0007B9A692|nr:PREDICTED: protein stum homolog [Sinocyclocheilus rhinocerous]
MVLFAPALKLLDSCIPFSLLKELIPLILDRSLFSYQHYAMFYSFSLYSSPKISLEPGCKLNISFQNNQQPRAELSRAEDCKEKKGALRAAIPYMPFPVAVICLFLNTFVPGLGTFISAFTVLCGARTDLPDRHMCCVFWLNIAAAFIQIVTAIVMVGWIMSIFWGMDMVILAISEGYREQAAPQQL